MMDKLIVAITGGIGSGKSVVCNILRTMGYEVYDCDANARRLMDTSTEIKRRLSTEICETAVLPDGAINRKAISEVVFSNPAKLTALNNIVHGCVRDDLLNFFSASDKYVLFFETAILQESGLDKVANEVWQVYAPEEVRVKRVMKRNGHSAAEVKARIDAQNSKPIPNAKTIVNDDVTPLLPQINTLLYSLKQD